jgi:glucokinase
MTVHSSQGEVLAIDVGGTKLAAAWVDDAGAVRASRSVPTTAAPTHALHHLIETALTDRPDQILGVGIGSAGPVDHHTGTVSPVNIPA